MIKIEYVIKGTEDLNLYCLDNKKLSDYNNPQQLLKEVFGKYKLVYATNNVFCVAVNNQTMTGIIQGGN